MSSMVSLVPMDKAVAADETGVVANVEELILQCLVELIFYQWLAYQQFLYWLVQLVSQQCSSVSGG